MATFIKLKRTPIKEIIYTISFMENVDEKTLEDYISKPLIKETFPIIIKGFNAQVQPQNNLPPTTKVSVDGFILSKNNPNNKLLTVRKGSLSFQLVNFYEDFESIVNELSQYWTLFVATVGKLTVNGLSIRYLNFIELLENDKVDDLITIITKHPFGDIIQNTFTQHRFLYHNNPSIVITVVTTLGKADLKDGIIVDIILNRSIENENIFNFNNFSEMRDAKNDTFFKSITEKTIKKYI